MTTTPARIHCCVPFCKRTAKVIDPLDPGEMICREHGALTSKHTRRFMLRMRRKAEKAMQQAPDDYTEQEQRYVLRIERIARKAWLIFKFEAIEKAGGMR